MIEVTNPKNLYKKVELAKKQLKNAKTKEEVVALTTYIEQLYASIGFVSVGDIASLDMKVFANKHHIKANNKKYIISKDKLIKNYLLQQDFHRYFFERVFQGINREMRSLGGDEYSPITELSKDDYYTIFFEFMSSLGLSSLFDKYIKNQRIYSGVDDDVNTLGFTIINPLTKEADVFVGDMQYDIYSMYVLAHEFGHVYDLCRLDGGAKGYNKYRIESFYQEITSKTFERLFIDFLLERNILNDETLDLMFDMNNWNYLYIFAAYIISLLPEEYIVNEEYIDMKRTQIYKMIKDRFNKKSNVKKVLNRMSDFQELQEDYSYAYGDVISMFFKERIKESDYSL